MTRVLTIAERNAERARDLGWADRVAPVPFREGQDRVRRCTGCGHIPRAHWYDSGDSRFKSHPGTRWCQICGAFCQRERSTTGRGRVRAPADCRAVRSEPAQVPAPSRAETVPIPAANGGEA